MKKMILLIIAMVPIPSISIMAHAKINELNNQKRINVLDNSSVKEARRLLWTPGAAQLTLDEMYSNFSSRSDLESIDEIDKVFDLHLQNLIDGGLLRLEEQVASMAPSIQ